MRSSIFTEPDASREVFAFPTTWSLCGCVEWHLGRGKDDNAEVVPMEKEDRGMTVWSFSVLVVTVRVMLLPSLSYPSDYLASWRDTIFIDEQKIGEGVQNETAWKLSSFGGLNHRGQCVHKHWRLVFTSGDFESELPVVSALSCT